MEREKKIPRKKEQCQRENQREKAGKDRAAKEHDEGKFPCSSDSFFRSISLIYPSLHSLLISFSLILTLALTL
jgi:hypothetical protein